MYRLLDWNTGLTEDDTYYSDIFDYVESFLVEANSVAVLQQIPYKYKDSGNNWNISPIFTKFYDRFKEKNSIVANDGYKNGFLRMLTVIVTNIDDISRVNECIYSNDCPTNREAAIKINDKFSILGIHVHGGDSNLSEIQCINEKADVIVGDFNAGDYLDYDDWKEFRQILPSHVCLCNSPTKRVVNAKGELIRESCIDHIFVKRNMVTRCSDVRVHNEITLSDHYPITFCIV